MTAPILSEDSIIAASDPSNVAINTPPQAVTAEPPQAEAGSYIDVGEQLAAAKEALKELKLKAKELTEAGEPIPPEFEKTFKNLSRIIDQIERSKYYEGEFSHQITDLCQHEPFLSSIFMSMTRRADFRVPTAYVSVHRNGGLYDVVFGFNPTFIRSLTPMQRMGVFRHECYHVVFNHIFIRAMGDKRYSKLWNYATDLAINSIIGKHSLPEMVLLPGHRSVDPETGEKASGPYADWIATAPLGKSSDYYFAELVKIMHENNHTDPNQITIGIGGGTGDGTMDNHDGWDDIPEEVQDEIRERIRDLVEQGANAADSGGKGWGSMPSEIEKWIRQYLSREIDWRSVVKSFFGRVRSQERASTMKRINKKTPYINPGVKRKTKAKFVCFIDQSGSMSDKDIAMLFGELENFAKETEIDVYHFDTEIDVKSHTVWKKGMTFPKPHRTRCGGTDFDAVANFCNDRRNPEWSGVVILTDGYAPVMGAIRNAKTLWVITETGTMETVRPGDLAVRMASGQKSFKRF